MKSRIGPPPINNTLLTSCSGTLTLGFILGFTNPVFYVFLGLFGIVVVCSLVQYIRTKSHK